MSIFPKIKKIIQDLPEPMGSLFATVPYEYRFHFGKLYKENKIFIKKFQDFDCKNKKQYVFEKTKKLVLFSYATIEFYKNLYDIKNFNVESLQSFDDIQRIPIVTKGMLREWDLEKRSSNRKGRYVENTGGSSGHPLNFYILPSMASREWAHMHHIWSKFSYTQKDLKLFFAGRNLHDTPVQYDALRNHYAVNIYYPWDAVVDSLNKLLCKRKIKYLHGYPSAIYDFACFCEQNAPEFSERLSQDLKGIFLGSEYPAEVYRNKIEQVFNTSSVSWYGHTERAVLAWERNEKFLYEPFQTYGYTEGIKDRETGKTKLVATSYENFASPFIRYDTGDEIKVVSQDNGILESFKIATGREGDYIIDSLGKRISLTGLIFGRHHPLFDVAQFLQISQDRPGYATIIVTPMEKDISIDRLRSLFDYTGVNIEFEFCLVDSPFLTESGKVNLKVDPKTILHKA